MPAALRSIRALAISLTMLGALGAASPLPAQTQPPALQISPVSDSTLLNPPPQDWLMWRRTLDSWGYSPLREIDATNVGLLQLAWARGLEPGVQEGTPLVHDGVLYFPNPKDIIQAFDATTGDLLWEHRRPNPPDIEKFINAPFINRNLAIYQHLIIDTSADGAVYALDARTGKEVWTTQVLDYRTGVHQTSGPIVADGKVITGRGCEPLPDANPHACVIVAHDALTGRELWRTRTIPGPGEPGNESWGDIPFEERKHVGAWMVPSYDPELKMLFMGTSVTSPAPKFLMSGNDKKYLYHNSTLALDVRTGKIVWHYQHLVDHWDLDHTFERILLDTEVTPDKESVAWINPTIRPGEVHKVITGIPGKTGIVYTLDRRTGKFLWATPTIQQNVVGKIDGRTGAVTENPDALFSAKGDEATVCPGIVGGKNWPAGAYSPLTGAMYYPLQNMCSKYTVSIASRTERSSYGVRAINQFAPGTQNLGSIYAISAKTGKIEWKYEQRASLLSLVATGGGLLFGGDVAGRFRALDQRTGKVLWQTNLGAQVTGFPVTYSVRGKQYVAVSTGQAVNTAAYLLLTPEIRPSNNSNLYVFALPEGWQSARTTSTQAPGGGSGLTNLGAADSASASAGSAPEASRSASAAPGSASTANAAGSAASSSAAPGSAASGSAAPGSAAPGSAASGSAAPGSAAPGSAAPGSGTVAAAAGAITPASQCRRPDVLPSSVTSVTVLPNGQFKSVQSIEGKKIYTEQQCAICHGENMRGSASAPALADPGFRQAWQGRTLGALFDCMKASMPPGRGGSLSDNDYVHLIAAILEANGYTPGKDSSLLPDMRQLSRIQFGPAN